MGQSELSLGIQSQMLTVPMQSVRLGGGALGFAFPKKRFILAGGEETQTLEENQKRKRSRSGFSFRPPPPQAQAQSARWSFPILFPGFQLLLPEKERRALGEAERLLGAGFRGGMGRCLGQVGVA